MDNPEAIQIFRPSQRQGVIFHLGAIAILSGVVGWGLWQASLAQTNVTFLLFLVPALVAILIVPWLAYRFLALRGAYYSVMREGITLRWGLRSEDIPIDAIAWIRPATDLNTPLLLPWLRLPGAVLGVRHSPSGSKIEFLAADARNLVLIACHGQVASNGQVASHGQVASQQGVFAISPEAPAAFLATYQRLIEMGSLAPMPARSQYPTVVLARMWRTPAARTILLLGLALNLILLIWVFLVAPGKAEIIIGFQRGGEPVPGVQLLLLPVLSGFFFLLDFFLGLFFFRRGVLHQIAPTETTSPPAPYILLAYLMWGSGVLIPVLFLVAFAIILIYPHL